MILAGICGVGGFAFILIYYTALPVDVLLYLGAFALFTAGAFLYAAIAATIFVRWPPRKQE